jgi:1-acyl-sn-glycerol-3-phosphate acyltransferase
MPARSGAARLALERDVPVIPLVHWGTLAVYDHYRRRFRPSWRTTITVKAGTPVPMDDLRARAGERGAEGGLLRETTERMMTAVRELLVDVRGEPAPAPTRGSRGQDR